MLSKEEWLAVEYRAAAAKRGERRERWHTFRRWYAVPTAICTGLGVLGYGAYRAWTAARSVLSSGASTAHGVSGAFWVLAFFAVVVTAAVVRPRVVPRPRVVTLVSILILAVMWLGLLGFLIGTF